jgi:hypothetical protein
MSQQLLSKNDSLYGHICSTKNANSVDLVPGFANAEADHVKQCAGMDFLPSVPSYLGIGAKD